MKPIEKLHLKSIKNCRNWWFSILRFSLRLAGDLPSIGVRRKKALLIERNSCLGIVNSKLIKNLKITALDCRVNPIGEYSCSEKPYGRNHRQIVSHWNCPNWCKLVIFRSDGVRQLDLYLICIWFVFASNKVLSVGEWTFSLCWVRVELWAEVDTKHNCAKLTLHLSWIYIQAASESKLPLHLSCIYMLLRKEGSHWKIRLKKCDGIGGIVRSSRRLKSLESRCLICPGFEMPNMLEILSQL